MAEQLLRAVIPLGRLNVVALVVAPLTIVYLARGRLSDAGLQVWVLAIWCGAAAQGLAILSRRWSGLTARWERRYAAVEVGLGAALGGGLAIPVESGEPLTAHLILLSFLVMTTSAAVVAFAGSRLIGTAFLCSQWGTFLAIALAQGRVDIGMVGLVVFGAGVAYLQLTHHFLVQSIVAQVRTVELSEELRILATTDSLTGLLNRRAVMEILELCLAAGACPTVLFVDLDGFKGVNDRHGHAAGDEVIVESARRLRSALRDGDVLGRLGGDEFVVLLTGGGDNDERELPRRITERLAEPMGNQGLTVTASVGLAVASEFESADQVLGRADLAMYAAKSLGGNTVAALRSDAEGARRLGVMPSGRS